MISMKVTIPEMDFLGFHHFTSIFSKNLKSILLGVDMLDMRKMDTPNISRFLLNSYDLFIWIGADSWWSPGAESATLRSTHRSSVF